MGKIIQTAGYDGAPTNLLRTLIWIGFLLEMPQHFNRFSLRTFLCNVGVSIQLHKGDGPIVEEESIVLVSRCCKYDFFPRF